MTHQTDPAHWQAIPFSRVRINDFYWSPRMTANREESLPYQYHQCKTTGRIDAFKLDWTPGSDSPQPNPYWDSDVAKWIEAAAYSLAQYPDPLLEGLVDETIALIASAQQPDGYLNVFYTVVEPENRFKLLSHNHELYCGGHLIEAAVAYYEATGKRVLLETMMKYADYIATVFGREAGQLRGYCGHEEIELALMKLFEATGVSKYKELAQYFVDERGQQPSYYAVHEREALGDLVEKLYQEDFSYCQAHAPVREQSKIVGHAVRAMYLYCGMADLAKTIGDKELLAACERIWEHLCGTSLYITGGMGSSRLNEGFTTDYDLPNETAYAETCAAIAFMMWNHRMLQIDCDAKYADMLERALYNGVISGVSLDGKRFFYENPLASRGDHHRSEWFDVSCCPTNLARLLASLGQYMYTLHEGEAALAVHLYIASETEASLGGRRLNIRQTHRYPHDGLIRLTLEPDAPVHLALKLRIPEWCSRFNASVNGQVIEPEECRQSVERGYLTLKRLWQAGDEIELELDMTPRRMYAHPLVHANQGRVALQMGPVLYCIEQADNGAALDQIMLPRDAALVVREAPHLLGGTLTIEASALRYNNWSGHLYGAEAPAPSHITLAAIPYALWDNREGGEMQVWIRER